MKEQDAYKIAGQILDGSIKIEPHIGQQITDRIVQTLLAIQQEPQVMLKIADEDIKLIIRFAKGLAEIFNKERSSNAWFWLQQAMPNDTVEWNSTQELLDKIIKITNDSNFSA